MSLVSFGCLVVMNADAKPEFPLDLTGVYDDPVLGGTHEINLFLTRNGRGAAWTSSLTGPSRFSVVWTYEQNAITIEGESDGVPVTFTGSRIGRGFTGTFSAEPTPGAGVSEPPGVSAACDT